MTTSLLLKPYLHRGYLMKLILNVDPGASIASPLGPPSPSRQFKASPHSRYPRPEQPPVRADIDPLSLQIGRPPPPQPIFRDNRPQLPVQVVCAALSRRHHDGPLSRSALVTAFLRGDGPTVLAGAAGWAPSRQRLAQGPRLGARGSPS